MSASIDSNDTFPLANHFIFDQTKGVRDAIIDAFSRFVLPFGPNSSDVGANSQRSRYQCCISSYFHRTEGRGKNCVVEAFRRDYFFAYPEDYSRQSIEWVEGRFDRRPHKPAFEVIYVYSQNEGTLDLSFRGSHKAPFRGTPDVFYLGADQHVHLLYFNGAWYTSDVTAATGAPNAAPGSALTDLLDTVYQTPDVFYLGADGHVHLLYFNGAWYTSDVTAAAGGPPA